MIGNETCKKKVTRKIRKNVVDVVWLDGFFFLYFKTITQKIGAQVSRQNVLDQMGSPISFI